MKKTDSTNIDFTLVTKYLFIGISVSVMLIMVYLITMEVIHVADDSSKRIASYMIIFIVGLFMIFIVSRLFDPNRKKDEREELFASIREAMKEHRNTVNKSI